MNLHLDPKTRADIKGVGDMFLRPPYPCSGCFNSASLAPERIQKVHINPPKLVKVSQDKAALMKALQFHGFEVPDYVGMSDFYEGGAFDLEEFQNLFPFDDPESDVYFKGPGLTTEMESLVELLELLCIVPDKDVAKSIFQELEKGGQTASISVLPQAMGTQFNSGANKIVDGLLGHNLPVSYAGKTHAIETACSAAQKLGYDYAHVIVAIAPDTIEVEIVDIVTDLRPTDVLALRAYMDTLHYGKKTKK